MKNPFRKILSEKMSEVDKYNFTKVISLLQYCLVLKNQEKHIDAIALYEKYENEINISNFQIIGLTTIIKICESNGDTVRLVNYAKKLKFIDSKNDCVIRLSRYYDLE
jgi:hypothetical protein